MGCYTDFAMDCCFYHVFEFYKSFALKSFFLTSTLKIDQQGDNSMYNFLIIMMELIRRGIVETSLLLI